MSQQTQHQQHPQDTRTHVVGELYDTERSYVESLQILTEVSIEKCLTNHVHLFDRVYKEVLRQNFRSNKPKTRIVDLLGGSSRP